MVTRLVDAINRGAVDSVDQLVAKGDAFKWYSVGSERIGEAARDRSTLKSYLTARHAQGELFRVIRFRYQGEAGKYANFSMSLRREALDYPARWILGKGATDCQLRSPQVAVWSLGSAPVPCSAQGARLVTSILIDALNRGDVGSVDQLVAKGDAFKWYSVSGKAGRRTGEAASNRDTLKRYVAARHKQRERLRLIRFRYLGVIEDRYPTFSTVLIRGARDYRAKRISGRGSLNCQLSPPQVAAWSLGS